MPYEPIEGMSSPAAGVKYEKHPLLLEKNPKGLIPTLVVNWPDGREEVVTQSLAMVEYIDDLAAKFELKGTPLLPRDDTAERQRILKAASFYNENIASPFYAVLMRNDKTEFDKMVAGAEKFVAEMRGPFFNGSQMCLVDVTIYPWIQRSFLLGHYKGATLDLSRESQPQLGKLFDWYDRMSAVDEVKATIMPPDYFIKVYAKLAEGVAFSQISKAIMRGEPAHSV
ncbi:Glutathione S-transferase U1 [Perkinsus olseni]|uniref:Glutathione S-transferase U1 n=1 Tax=Perkinsus olseni TaxID=32597 RepID=A0A7J6QP27_PEROL|nr:Glutathione S-transferase U1 [Perkinsus olseni]